MATLSQPPASGPQPADISAEVLLRRMFAYRGLEGRLFLGLQVGIVATSLLFWAVSKQPMANAEAPQHWDDLLLLLLEGVAVSTIGCGLALGLRLLWLLRPWWTRIFPALAMLSVTLLLLPLVLAIGTPLELSFVDAIAPVLLVVMSSCVLLGLVGVAVSRELRRL